MPEHVKVLVALIALALQGSFHTTAVAEPVTQGFRHLQSVGASYNPLGVLLDSRLYYRIPLSRRSGILWESAKIDMGIQNEWTPADNLLACRVTVEPIAIFSLTGRIGYYGLYDCLGYGFYGFASARDSYGARELKELDPGSASGMWYSLSPELKLKAGRVICLNTLNVNHIVLDREGYFLEIRSYAIHANTDTDVENVLAVMWEVRKTVLLGANYRYLHVNGTRADSHRVGVMAVGLPDRIFPRTTFALATAGMYLDDRRFHLNGYVAARMGIDVQLGPRRVAAGSAR